MRQLRLSHYREGKGKEARAGHALISLPQQSASWAEGRKKIKKEGDWEPLATHFFCNLEVQEERKKRERGGSQREREKKGTRGRPLLSPYSRTKADYERGKRGL